MNGKAVAILITAAVLLLLLIIPTLYMHAEIGSYLDSIDEIKSAIREKDDARALALYNAKFAGWDENNTLILAITPHAETENIKDFILELKYSLDRKEYGEALEKADLLYARIEHLITGSKLSWENIF